MYIYFKMTTTYTKSLSGDFSNGLKAGQFHSEVYSDVEISPNLIQVIETGDVIEIIFDNALDVGEQTTLDVLITNHVPSSDLATEIQTVKEGYDIKYDSGPNESMVMTTEGIPRFRIEDTGVLSVVDTANYETLVTDDNDIPNKKYIDSNVSNVSVVFHYEIGNNENNITTSASSYTDTGADISGMTYTIPTGGEYIIFWAVTVDNTNKDKTVYLQIFEDLNTVGVEKAYIQKNTTGSITNFTTFTAVAGEIIQAKWYVSANVGNMYSRIMMVIKL